jgi:polysaccharide pyruvyl transferase WcaK-like protein
VRPPLQRTKSITRNGWDRLATQLTGKLRLDNFHYQVANNLDDNSNRGDIAIRMAVKEQLSAALCPRDVNFIEVKWGTLNDTAVREINERCDLFLIAGGGYIFLDADGRLGACSKDIPWLKKIRCPVIAYGVGLNQLMHEKVSSLRGLPAETAEQVRDFVGLCHTISVRDLQTLELLELYGTKPIVLTGDPVLFWKGDGAAPGKNHRAPSSRPRVGINLAAHGWRALLVLKPILPAVVELLKELQSREIALTYLLHHDFERPLIPYLRQQGLRMDMANGSPLQLLEAYQDCDFVICQMLHSCIFAANRDVPFLNIAYDQKNLAFCDLLGISRCTTPHTAASSSHLRALFDRLFDDRAAIQATIAANKEPIGIAQLKFAEACASEFRQPA